MSEARPAGRPTARLPWLDAARGAAVLAMFVFHFIWDLGHFGHIDPDFPYTKGVKDFGHAIAFAFLFIAGVGLVLAHGGGIRWRAFARRLLIVAGAAALVSAGTYVAFPQNYVFFGILHCIAAASLLAAPFLTRAGPAALAGAILAGAAPLLFSGPLFDAPLLRWIGLSTAMPFTNDYRPLFPWSGALLLGVAAAKFCGARVGAPAGAGFSGRSGRGLRLLGRHSLLLYLLHQPVLFALFSAAAAIAPATDEKTAPGFIPACETQCVSAGGAESFCRAACLCTAETIVKRRALDAAADAAERQRRVDDIARECARRAE